MLESSVSAASKGRIPTGTVVMTAGGELRVLMTVTNPFCCKGSWLTT